MGFGMRRRGGRSRPGRRRVGRRFHVRNRRYRRRTGRGNTGLLDLIMCCFGCCCPGDDSQVDAVNTDVDVHKNVLDLQQQQTYLIQERQMAEQFEQSADPAEKAKAEATRKSGQDRFNVMAQSQKTTYDAAVAMQPTVTDPEAARQLAEDMAYITGQVRYLQDLGYVYTDGVPGQPAAQTTQT